jgi:hypothetical protein
MTGAAPSGVVTFLFTDVEGSTRRWEADPDEMRLALTAHDAVLRGAIEAHGGFMFKHTGDGVWPRSRRFAGFGRAARLQATACADVARYRRGASALRPSSREIVEGLRPIRLAIARIDSPAARPNAISSRSAKLKYRPFTLRPRRGRTPPLATTHRAPCLRYVPAASAASVMNSPPCNAAQNTCTFSLIM